jgi:hypothetical protein
VKNLPYVVVIKSRTPPPDLIAITSVQKGGEELVPANRANVSWVPYVPDSVSKYARRKKMKERG